MKELYPKTICLDFTNQENYEKGLKSRKLFGKFLERDIKEHPELFPEGINNNWCFFGLTRTSKKTGIKMRKIQIGKEVYQIRPSFVMPYQIGFTEPVSQGFNMKINGASFERVVENYGRNAMYWYRAFISIGRNSIVGTTVKTKIPENILIDEKHTWQDERKLYLATTIGEGCILGSSLTDSPDEDNLTYAYSEFKEEALKVEENYIPKSVNTDGWSATQNAIRNLFIGVTLILCFLHSVLKIRDKRRKYEKKDELMKKVWDAYKAKTLSGFSQRLRRLKDWVNKEQIPEVVREKVLDLCEKKDEFKVWYDNKEAHRASNMLDRIMDWQDRMLYNMRYFHRNNPKSAILYVRAMALCWNFHRYGKRVGRHSPFEDLNGFVYHQNWLENMMIATSLQGRAY